MVVQEALNLLAGVRFSHSLPYLQAILTLRAVALGGQGLTPVSDGTVRAVNNYERNVHMPNLIDDEMTEQDWEEYSREFEARYNEHLNSIKSSSPRRVGKACTVGKRVANRYYYNDNDDIGLYLPTEEEILYLRRSLMPDPIEVISSMTRPHEDTMAAFFLESQW